MSDSNARLQRNTAERLLLLTAVLATGCSAQSDYPPSDPAGNAKTPLSLGVVNVLTHHNDNFRSGANLLETSLDTTNVASGFGKVFSLDVDDQIYAQPLYASAVPIVSAASGGCGLHDLVYVATMNNSVYAFDADTPGAPVWQKNFNGSGRPVQATEVGSRCVPYNDISANIGIVGTPVIDPASGTMYFVARTVEPASADAGAGLFLQRLHAVDITTGAERSGSPVDIRASISDPEAQAPLVFDAQIQNQRAALTLSRGKVVVAWTSHCDSGQYHGWAMSYDAATLTQSAVFNDTPTGGAAGIWQSGGGAAVDVDGNLYFATGNGDWDGVRNFGESIIKLSPQTLRVTDYFTPYDWPYLNDTDQDFGASGPLLLPNSDLLVLGGKRGKVYVTHRGNLGHTNASSDQQIAQVIQAGAAPIPDGATHHVHGGEVYWSGPQGPTIYTWPENEYVRAYRLLPGGPFDPTAASVGSMLAAPGMPGGMLSISANGSKAGTGILWAALPLDDDANHQVVRGVLRAFDASDLTTELWNSAVAPADDPGNFAKFVPPTIANGRVYLATFSNKVVVYGLLPSPGDASLDDGSASAGDDADIDATPPGTGAACPMPVAVVDGSGPTAADAQLMDATATGDGSTAAEGDAGGAGEGAVSPTPDGKGGGCATSARGTDPLGLVFAIGCAGAGFARRRRRRLW